MTITVDDPREQLVLVEAITFAIEGMSRLPATNRPESNIKDLKELLGDMSPRDLPLFQSEARRRVDSLLGTAP